jgi:hypothetical protein
MDVEKRSTEEQTRELMMSELSDAQKVALNQLEAFGWYLCFVRRPLFKDVVPVMRDDDSGRFAVLETDGSLNQDHDLDIRSD